MRSLLVEINITWPDGTTQNNLSGPLNGMPYTFSPTVPGTVQRHGDWARRYSKLQYPHNGRSRVLNDRQRPERAYGTPVTFTAVATGAINPGGVQITWADGSTRDVFRLAHYSDE